MVRQTGCVSLILEIGLMAGELIGCKQIELGFGLTQILSATLITKNSRRVWVMTRYSGHLIPRRPYEGVYLRADPPDILNVRGCLVALTAFGQPRT